MTKLFYTGQESSSVGKNTMNTEEAQWIFIFEQFTLLQEVKVSWNLESFDCLFLPNSPNGHGCRWVHFLYYLLICSPSPRPGTLLFYFFLSQGHLSDPPTLTLADICLPQEQPLSINHTSQQEVPSIPLAQNSPLCPSIFFPGVGKDFPWFPFSFPTEMRKQFSLTFRKQTTAKPWHEIKICASFREYPLELFRVDCPTSQWPKAVWTQERLDRHLILLDSLLTAGSKNSYISLQPTGEKAWVQQIPTHHLIS